MPKRQALGPLLTVGPPIVLLLILFIYPVAFAIFVSFHKWSLLSMDFKDIIFVGADNYVRILTGSFFWRNTMWLTLIYTGIGVVAEFALGLMLAVLASQQLRFLRAIRVIYIIPILMAPTAVGYVFRYVFEPNIGIANWLLLQIGLSRQPWYAHQSSAIWTLILIDIWQWTPFMFLILLAGIFALPAEPFESASIDGASSFNKFRFITVKLLKPVILIALLLRLMDSLKMIDIAYVTTKGGPAQQTETITYAILRQSFEVFQMGDSTAMSIILLIVMNVVANLTFRYLRWE